MQTIVDLMEESCRKFPGKAALRHKIAGVWQDISFEALRTTSGQIAAGLTKNGFKAGDHAALLAPSSPRWVIAYFGILKAGGIVIPIDKDLKNIELQHILADCAARVLFTDSACLDTAHELIKGLPSLHRIVMLRPPQYRGSGHIRSAAAYAGPGDGWEDLAGEGRLRTFEDLVDEELLSPVLRGHGDTAVILYTSGTTGRPKGAMLSHANIVANITGAVAHFRLDESVHTLSFLPISHVFEQVCGILLPLSLGGTVSFCESLKKLGENLNEVKPTFFLGVPAVYRMILDRIMKKIGASMVSRFLFSCPATRPLITGRILRSFASGTIFISGGAALDPAIASGLERLGLRIYQGYGITETSPIIAAECPGFKRLGTVGRPLKNIEVRIDSPDEEMVGEILVKGPNVMEGYYRNPQATNDALVDGWYRTGDLGRLDPDGFLSILGRVKNLIVTPNGKNVYPEEVENELLKSPYIAEAVVYGQMVAPSTEEIHATIYPNREAVDAYDRKRGKSSMTAADLEALLRAEVSSACERLAVYKRVRKFTIREDEFPKTATRKVKRCEMDAINST
jgi:long-chain acyl-CoA synthetase